MEQTPTILLNNHPDVEGGNDTRKDSVPPRAQAYNMESDSETEDESEDKPEGESSVEQELGSLTMKAIKNTEAVIDHTSYWSGANTRQILSGDLDKRTVRLTNKYESGSKKSLHCGLISLALEELGRTLSTCNYLVGNHAASCGGCISEDRYDDLEEDYVSCFKHIAVVLGDDEMVSDITLRGDNEKKEIAKIAVERARRACRDAYRIKLELMELNKRCKFLGNN